MVFYDKGRYSDGWRYLEAAPTDQSSDATWATTSSWARGTATVIGSGKPNTDLIVSKQGEGNYAAAQCRNLALGGYDDWFLPSKDELNQMYVNLKQQNRGGFASEMYWTSSEDITHHRGEVFVQSFLDGGQDSTSLFTGGHVRAVRAF